MNDFVQYEHHGKLVWVRAEHKDCHRAHCLCWSCAKLNTADKSKNCVVARALFELCVKFDVVTPVWECPVFERGTPITEVSQSTVVADSVYRGGIETRVIDIVRGVIGTDVLNPESEITLASDLTRDLYADELDVLDILISCEDEFDIDIFGVEQDNWHTVGDVANLVVEKLEERWKCRNSLHNPSACA